MLQFFFGVFPLVECYTSLLLEQVKIVERAPRSVMAKDFLETEQQGLMMPSRTWLLDYG